MPELASPTASNAAGFHPTPSRAPSRARSRAMLRAEIWRHAKAWLALVVGFVALTGYGIATGFTGLAIDRYDDVGTLDAVIRWGLGFVAFSLALIVNGRSTASFRSLSRRLPVDPVLALQAQLQIALTLGAVAFATLTLIEILAQPPMLHPSIESRLNPAETATLERLPGVPLLRFTVDGNVSHALASELSLAAMQTPGSIAAWGVTSRWPHYQGVPGVSPGDLITSLEPADWLDMPAYVRSEMRRLGVPEGATVEVALERYVPREEYLAEPWRRDGLHRERRWHALDRAVAFFGIVCFLVCALRPEHSSLLLNMAAPFALSLLHLNDFGQLVGRRQLLFSDMGTGRRPRMPSLDAQQTWFESLLWPALVVVLCGLVYRFVSRELRTSTGEPYGKGMTFLAHLKVRWRAGLRHRLELVVVPCLLLAYVASLIPSAALNPSHSTSMVWSFAMVATAPLVLALVFRWERRDALLSRLPVDPSAIALRRLATALGSLAALALVPHLVELSTSSSSRWTLILLILAIGTTILSLTLLLRIFGLLGRAGVMAGFFAVMVGLMASWTLSPAIRVAACLLLIGLQLPLSYHLLRTNVARGRAPSFAELTGATL